MGLVRLTEFHEWVRDEFGEMRGEVLLSDHVMASLGGRTPGQAIEAGEDPRDVWRRLCEEFDVPRDRS
ncbi:hypothetical protein Rrhod_1565 [Rhodococcus rhodnii LMG 5362]|uniref:DUF3046 domain-containing protein n=1 Tax=Rhodococcus rhodnii LMG 5362 TaxID=1273125 RepID=R7WP59_9NOCA|nr:hypothetical protein Rrhod_1565 [Rhodococcus rhodnii LMG 5362]